MDLAHLLLFLHISLMFMAISVGFGLTTFLYVAYATGQVAAVRGVGMVAGRVGPAIPILFVLGGLFGLFTAISFGFNLLAPWLIIAYVVFAIAAIIGFAYSNPFALKLRELLMAAPDGPIQGDLKEHFTNQRGVVLEAINYLSVFVLIFDMVVKPFS